MSSSWHWGIVFTKEHLQHLNSARHQACVFDKLAHFIWTQLLQAYNLPSLSTLRASDTSERCRLRFSSSQSNQLQEYHIWVCANLPKKTITTAVKQSVYEKNLEYTKLKLNGTITLGPDGSFSLSAATNQQNSVRDVVQSQIQIITSSGPIQQAYHNT